jgi:DNA-binding response OmpR family regulator
MLNLHVLLADDEPDIREIIDISLSLDPFMVLRSFSSGSEALKGAAEWRPDLILLDVMMPVMDGPMTLAQLRADRRTATIPVVFMTARTQTRERAGFMSSGAIGVIAKPFDPVELPALVRACLPADIYSGAGRDDFLRRMCDTTAALATCRSGLAPAHEPGTLTRIKHIARTLSDTIGRDGFAGISLESAALEEAVDRELAGRGRPKQVEQAVDRVLSRIEMH